MITIDYYGCDNRTTIEELLETIVAVSKNQKSKIKNFQIDSFKVDIWYNNPENIHAKYAALNDSILYPLIKATASHNGEALKAYVALRGLTRHEEITMKNNWVTHVLGYRPYTNQYFGGLIAQIKGTMTLADYWDLLNNSAKMWGSHIRKDSKTKRTPWSCKEEILLKLASGSKDDITPVLLPNTSATPNKKLWEYAKNIILYGPPGTGKTWRARQLAREIVKPEGDEDAKKRIKLVQFHPSYSYFDFVEGIEAGPGGFQRKSKLFRTLCETAQKDRGMPYVLIVDEINRADAAAVLGELLYGLEYRNAEITTPVSDKPLSVPDNLYVIGTMNTADQSIATLDYAVRRRFAFAYVPAKEPEPAMLPDESLFCKKLFERVKGDLEISVARGVRADDIMPGASYFLVKKNPLSNNQADSGHRKYKIQYELIPLLREYAKNGLISKRKQLENGTRLYELLKNGEYQKILLELEGEGGGSP